MIECVFVTSLNAYSIFSLPLFATVTSGMRIQDIKCILNKFECLFRI